MKGITLILISVCTFCSFGQLENLVYDKEKSSWKILRSEYGVLINKELNLLTLTGDDYNHTFSLSKKELDEFGYFNINVNGGNYTSNESYISWASILKNRNVAFYSSGKRIARIDMVNNTIQTLERPYIKGASFQLEEKTFENDNIAYYRVIPSKNGYGFYEFYKVDFKTNEVVKVFNVPSTKNPDLMDTHLEGDIVFTFDIEQGIRIYNLQTNKQIRHIKCLDIIPPIVFKDLSNVRSVSISITWRENQPILWVRIDDVNWKWDYSFSYNLHKGFVTEDKYEHDDLPKNELTPIWTGDKHMFYESVVKVKELKTVSLPRNKPKMINWTTEPAIANYQQYMDEFLKIREETETFIQGLGDDKLVALHDKYEDHIPWLFKVSQEYYISPEENKKLYKKYKKHRAIITPEELKKMEAYSSIIKEEYFKLAKRNNEIRANHVDKLYTLYLYADERKIQLVHTFENALRMRGVKDEKYQVEVTKVDEYGEYLIIFDLQKKEVLSTTRKTDF